MTRSVIYFPLYLALPCVLIRLFLQPFFHAHSCPPSLCSFSSPSRVFVVGSSLLCPLNIDRTVVCGWEQRMLFLSLSLSFCCSLYQVLSSEGHTQSASQVLNLLATLPHIYPSYLLCLFLFLSPLEVISIPKCCVLSLYGPRLTLFLLPLISLMGPSWPSPKVKAGF